MLVAAHRHRRQQAQRPSQRRTSADARADGERPPHANASSRPSRTLVASITPRQAKATRCQRQQPPAVNAGYKRHTPANANRRPKLLTDSQRHSLADPGSRRPPAATTRVTLQPRPTTSPPQQRLAAACSPHQKPPDGRAYGKHHTATNDSRRPLPALAASVLPTPTPATARCGHQQRLATRMAANASALPTTATACRRRHRQTPPPSQHKQCPPATVDGKRPPRTLNTSATRSPTPTAAGRQDRRRAPPSRQRAKPPR